MRFLGLVFMLWGASTFAQMTGSFNQTTPALPQFWIATTLSAQNYPDLFNNPVIKTVKASGGNYTSLQAAFTAVATDAPNCGEIIIVDSGYTSDSPGDGQTITYSMTCPAGQQIWVQPSNLSLLPAQDTRVQLSDKANMFTIAKSSSTQHFDAAFTVADGASGLIITGMDTEISGPFVAYGWKIGSSQNSSNYATRIMIDRSYLDTTYATQMNQVVFNGATWFALVDSVVDHVNLLHSSTCSVYTESHDYISFNSSGPVKLVNNLFGGAPTENVFFGGAQSAQPGINPSDYEVRRNVLYKDPAQIPNADVKNVFEFKNGIRFLVDGNTMQYSQADYQACGGNQHGVAIDFNVAASAPNNYWSEVSNVTFTNNDIQHMNSMGNIQGHSFSNVQWPVTAEISIVNNLFRDVNHYLYVTSPTTSISAASLTSNVISFTVGSTSGITAGVTTIVVSGFTGADTYFNGLHGIQSIVGSVLSSNFTHADGTATTGPGTGSAITYNDSGWALESSGFSGSLGTTVGLPGPYYVTTDHNAYYGSNFSASGLVNGAQVNYINLPKGCGGGTTVMPFWIFTNNVAVTDATSWNADCGATPAVQFTNGVFPNFVTGGNVLFNFTKTGTDSCSNWSPYNPGACPAGLASSPATINATLGIADYATCSAGDISPGSLSLASCIITPGTYGAVGPNIAAIQAAQAVPNDSTNWGPRTPE
jgi:hypothetical protein